MMPVIICASVHPSQLGLGGTGAGAQRVGFRQVSLSLSDLSSQPIMTPAMIAHLET
jgi:hypothetical protein